MKKKLLTLALAAAMAFSLSASVFAADSASKGSSSSSSSTTTTTTTTTESTTTTTAASSADTTATTPKVAAAVGSTPVEVTVTDNVTTITEKATPAQKAPLASAASAINEATSGAPANLVNLVNTYSADKISNVTAVQLVDVALPNISNEALAQIGGVDITLTSGIAAGFTAGTPVRVLHLKNDGTWEAVPAVAGNGSVTFHVTSLSPIVVTAVTEDAKAGATGAATDATKAPKTGE